MAILVERYGLKWHEEDETVGNGFTGIFPADTPPLKRGVSENQVVKN